MGTRPDLQQIHSRHLSAGRMGPLIKLKTPTGTMASEFKQEPKIAASSDLEGAQGNGRLPFSSLKQKADIYEVLHPFTNVARGSSAELQSQAQDKRYFMEGKNRWLINSYNQSIWFLQNKNNIFKTFYIHFATYSHRVSFIVGSLLTFTEQPWVFPTMGI